MHCVTITLKLYVYCCTVPENVNEFTVRTKAFDPKSAGEAISDSSTEIVVQSPERLMYAAAGVRVAVIGHTIAGVAIYTSVLIATA